MIAKRGSTTTKTYAVSGKTLDEINKDMMKKGPPDPNEGRKYSGSCKGELVVAIGGSDFAFETTPDSSPLEVTATPYAIPGSCWLAAHAIHEHEAEFLRSRDVVLYCASAYDATSARVALQLKRKGITRVRPLEGGLAAWMALKFPVRPVHDPGLADDGSSGRVQSTAA